jgi:small subunit ribosomal protein S6
MNDYEMVVIVNPELDEAGKSGVVDNISKFISNKEGTIEETKQWGKKRLAYPIKGFAEGDYFLTQFKMKSNFIKKLEEDINASREILRALIVKKGK